MPLVNPAGRPGAGVGRAGDPPAGTVDELRPPDSVTRPAIRALADVRAALAQIAGDDEGRRLRAATGADPDPDGALAGWLYGRWWCGLDGLDTAAAAPPDAAAQGAARLEAARRSVVPTSDGWLVLAAAGTALLAAPLVGPGTPDRDRRRLRTTVEAVTSSSRPGCPPRPGDLVTLQHGGSGLDPSGSWWWAHADRPEDTAGLPLDRWYLHVRSVDTAVRAVPVLLEVAAEVGCPLSLKCPPTEQGYGRRDALVAYLPSAAGPAAEAALRRRADRLRQLLDPAGPPCTHQLLPGVARAQDPGPTSSAPVSYGQLRCGQVAAVAARFADSRPSDRELTATLAELDVDVAAIDRVLR
jgi:hypothetical protein